MMRIIDTHTHVFSEEFSEDIESIVNRAKQVGVEKMLLPNIDAESIDTLLSLTSSYPGYCLPMMGLHPTSVGNEWEKDLKIIKEELAKRNYVAIGEIGIDLYWDVTYKEAQMDAFKEQLRWSIEYDLPVSIHTRNAINEVIDCIEDVGTENLRGVFHSFGGTAADLKNILTLKNFLIGINGVVTFKNSTLGTVLQNADLSHIVIETDAPYLTPVPHRGKRNEPSYCVQIVNKLAEIYNICPEKVAEETSKNAEKMFCLSFD